MCGRYTPLTEDEIIEIRDIIKKITLRFVKDEFDDYTRLQKDQFFSQDNDTDGLHMGKSIPMREVVPTNRAPIVTSDGENLAFEYAKFGFEKWDGKGVIINARAETIKEKSMFKNHISQGRCVIPASGYYEWKTPENRNKEVSFSAKNDTEGCIRKKPSLYEKIKHLIQDKNGNFLFMAGLWRDFKSQFSPKNDTEGCYKEKNVLVREEREFVIITKKPFVGIREIHDRMPVILTLDKLEEWLSGEMPIEELEFIDYECYAKPCNENISNEQIRLF